MASRLSRSRLAALAAATVVVGAAAGCGVSPSAPEDRGDRLQAVTTVGDQVKSVPQPTASSADTLVSDFLMATVGGGEAAITQAKAFFTDEGAAAWKGPTDPPNPDLTVIHIVRGPTIGVLAGSRVPVTVDYQVVGQLNSQGRVDDLSRSTGGQMTFWVVPAPDNRYLRIGEIQGAPSGLLISDVALTEMYRIQPIYFWDANYEQLIPDLRYLPLTFTEVNRAGRLVQWLVGGPSSSLIGAARVLPSGTVAESVQIRDEKYVVNLNAVATADGGETPEHLLPQLRWSLSNGSNSRQVELQIDGKSVAADTTEAFRNFNQAWVSREIKPRFDIVDRKVVPSTGAAAPTVLASPDNLDVDRAAINRDETVMALVRLRPSGQRYLQIVKADGPTTLNVELQSFDMSRPSFVPGADPYVVVASNGGLYLISTENGAVRNITPNRIDDVTAVVVAPDGRRIAFIAGGQTYVTSLVVDGEGLTVGWANPRPILADRVVASGVAWVDDTWLYVGGTAAGAPAMWRVTADGVVAKDESSDLRGLPVTEVMAAPRWPASQYAEVIIYTSSGPYLFSTSTTQIGEQQPFFGG
jgi:hypothetical protein